MRYSRRVDKTDDGVSSESTPSSSDELLIKSLKYHYSETFGGAYWLEEDGASLVDPVWVTPAS